MPENTALVPQSSRSPVLVGAQGLQLTSLDDMFRFSTAVAQSGLAPRGIEKSEAIFVAIQMGAEIGLTPMAALQNIAIINGRPGIYGDAALALVRASGLMESYSQKTEGEGDQRRVVVKTVRVGGSEIETSFSVADARKAGLWGKSGPWSQYPERMLLFRARGFNLRDNFGDVLKGLKTTEELQDTPREPQNVTGTGEAGEEQAPPEEQQKDTRPPPPPRRGGAKAAAKAAEAAKADAAAIDVAATPAKEDAAAPAKDEAPAKAEAPPAETKEAEKHEALPAPPEIAQGVSLDGFHGKAWPCVLTMELTAVEAAQTPSGKPIVKLNVTHEETGFAGEVFTFEHVEVSEVTVDGKAAKKAVITAPFLKAGERIEANFKAKLRPSKKKDESGNPIPDRTRAPALFAEQVTAASAVEEF